MSLRLTALFFVFLFLVPLAAAGASPSETAPSSVQIRETLPFYDLPGFYQGYAVNGYYPNGTATNPNLSVHYSGEVSIRSLGVRGALNRVVVSSSAPAFMASGNYSDDPYFPSYVFVLPREFVVPEDFSVVSPSYGLFFVYEGNATVHLDGERQTAYLYRVSGSQGGQPSPAVRYFEVLASSGVVYRYNITNTYLNSGVSMTLTNLSVPTQSQSVNLSVPVYAQPGNYLNYTSSVSVSLYYVSLFATRNGAFYFEKTASIKGVEQSPEFFVDNYTKDFFYPGAYALSSKVSFGYALGYPQVNLSLLGETSVQTVYGKVAAYAYANRTLGFEAYINPQSGAAVYIELPQNAVLDLVSSNFVPLEGGSGVPITALVAAIFVLVAGYFMVTSRRRGTPRVRK